MQQVRLATNPQAALNQMLLNNPQLQNALQLVRQNGANPQQAFYALANQMGVDPNEVLSVLK